MTMTFALLLAALQAGSAPAPAPAPAQDTATPLVVPTDWTAMPPLPWRSEPVLSSEMANFVAGEVRAGRCPAPAGSRIEVRIAVFVRADGLIRAAVPRAINCPIVEQFAAGFVTSSARNNLRQPAAGWYQTSLTFAWGK